MENIAPPLVLLWEVKRSLEKGQSVGSGIKNYLKYTKTDEFQHQVEIWWMTQTNSQILYDKTQLNYKRQYLLEVLEAGLKGHSILQTLQSLEDELIMSCEDEIQKYVARLPMLSLIPLMFLIFPAMMLILILPLLKLLQL